MKYIVLIPPVAICKGGERRRVPYSPNKKLHWANQHKWKKAWQEMTYWMIKAQSVPKRERASVNIKVYSVKPMDKDNCYASLKGVVDGIVQAGVVKDDSNEYLDLEVKQIKVNRYNDEKVVLEIL